VSERPPVSVAIITLNEEERIRDCLESVKWAEEIVVVDSGSADGTEAICRDYTDKFFLREWEINDAQYNKALSLCTKEWVLQVDADERVSAEMAAEIRGLFEKPGGPQADGYTFPRKLFYLGRWLTHGGWYPDRKLRLFRKSRAKWVGGLHAKAVVEGKIAHLSGDLVHLSYRDIHDQVVRMERYAEVVARQKAGEGISFPLLRMVFDPPIIFVRRYFLQLGFLDGVPGLIALIVNAFYVFLKYAKLWELGRSFPREGTK